MTSGSGCASRRSLISPYAKEGFVDSTMYEFSSVLRFIEDNWGLTQLTRRDRIADNLTNALDFDQEPLAPAPQPLRTDCRGPIWDPPEGSVELMRAPPPPRRGCSSRSPSWRPPAPTRSPTDLAAVDAVHPGHLGDPDGGPLGGARGGRRRLRDHHADQARRVPDQGEPHVRQPVRDASPARDGVSVGMDQRRAPAAPPRDRRRHARRHPALLLVLDPRVERRPDGRLRPGRSRRLGVHAAAGEAAPELLALGRGERPVRQLLRLGLGPVVPEPPVHDRRAVRAARATTPAVAASSRTRSAATRPRSRSPRSTTPRATSSRCRRASTS